VLVGDSVGRVREQLPGSLAPAVDVVLVANLLASLDEISQGFERVLWGPDRLECVEGVPPVLASPVGVARRRGDPPE